MKKQAGRFILTVALFLALVSGTTAQQLPSFSQYMFSNMYYNPGFAGNSGGVNINGLFRSQYIGFKDDKGNAPGPVTFYLTGDAPIRFLHGGISGTVMKDQIGFFDNTCVNLGYAYRTDLGAGTLGVGFQVQLDNIKLDFKKFSEQIVDPDDPLLKEGSERTDLIFDGSLGIYYEVPDKYYIGLSGAQLLQSQGNNTYYRHRRTFTLTGGYNYILPNYPMWEIKPSAIIYYDAGSYQGNLSALVTYKKKFWGGIGYRYQDAAILLAGMNIKNLRIGLAYDICTSALTSYNSGSLEVTVGYCFKMELEKYRKRYKNTRFL